ncbi:MAG: hypothetical protein ACYDDF_08640 [Thermoplasmatota archaeon]
MAASRRSHIPSQASAAGTAAGPLAVLVLGIVLVILAGCIGPATPSATTNASTTARAHAPIDASGGAPLAFNFTSPACTETDVLFFEDMATVQQLLPTGFHAADAATLANLPAASGKGAILLANVVCPASSIGPVGESTLAALVDRPAVAGPRATSAFDFYELGRYVDTANESAPFEAMGWAHIASGIRVAAGLTMTGADGTVVQNGSNLVAFTDTLPPTGPSLQGIGRYWHVLPAGLGYMDYGLAATEYVGGAQCMLAPGSPFAAIVGAACGPGSSAGASFGTYKLDASIVSLPGATAGS